MLVREPFGEFKYKHWTLHILHQSSSKVPSTLITNDEVLFFLSSCKSCCLESSFLWNYSAGGIRCPYFFSFSVSVMLLELIREPLRYVYDYIRLYSWTLWAIYTVHDGYMKSVCMCLCNETIMHADQWPEGGKQAWRSYPPQRNKWASSEYIRTFAFIWFLFLPINFLRWDSMPPIRKPICSDT